MKNKYLFSIIALFILTLTMATVAQARGRGNRRGAKDGRLHYVKTAQLIDLLQLNEETAAKFIVKLNANRQERDSFRDKSRQLVQELETITSTTKPSAKAVEAKINELEKLYDGLNVMRKKHHKELKALLGTVKYGRYLAFENNWEGKMFKRIRGRRGSSRRMRGNQDDRPARERGARF